MNKSCRDIIALNLIIKLGPRSIGRLLKEVHSMEEIFYMPPSRLMRITGKDAHTVDEIRSIRETREYGEELEYIEKEGIDPVCCVDRGYSEALKSIYDPPSVLFCKGEFTIADTNAVAIVGSRRCSLYGVKMAEKIASELAKKGITIISGMARGVDAAAHRGALKVGGRTIAVMGSGFRNIYPAGSSKLVSSISKNGVVLTEYTSRTEPLRMNFPRRNRIISGLSKGVVVIEAAEKSGALITADFALEQGKEVFALPGRADSFMSRGANRLIQNGAKLVMDVSDILEEIEISAPVRDAVAGTKGRQDTNICELGSEERGVLGMLEEEMPLHVDRISEGAGTDPRKLAEILLTLEVKGLVKAMAGRNFVRNPALKRGDLNAAKKK